MFSGSMASTQEGFRLAPHRQVGLDDVHQRLHVEQRLLHVGAVVELQGDDGEAVLRGGAQK